jgi:hypothetical protein
MPKKKQHGNSLDERHQASKLPRGAGLMYLFCQSVERGEDPDPTVLQELAPIFRDLVAAVSDTGPRRQQRIVKSLQLEQPRGRKKQALEAWARKVGIATAVARARLAKTPKPMRFVADRYGVPFGTVRSYYATFKSVAELAAIVDARTDAMFIKYGTNPDNWPEWAKE